MKYLKLFEDHKETSDKISEIERLAKQQSDEVINQYKELIDGMMYDISDDYYTESEVNITDASYPHCKTYLDYKIYFTADKYEDLLSKLLGVVNRLKESDDVSYNIKGLFNLITSPSHLNIDKGRIGIKANPFDFSEAKKIVKDHITWCDENFNLNPSDVKLMIVISF